MDVIRFALQFLNFSILKGEALWSSWFLVKKILIYFIFACAWLSLEVIATWSSSSTDSNIFLRYQHSYGFGTTTYICNAKTGTQSTNIYLRGRSIIILSRYSIWLKINIQFVNTSHKLCVLFVLYSG